MTILKEQAMKRATVFGILLAAIASAWTVALPAQAKAPLAGKDGWQVLFDGKKESLEAWNYNAKSGVWAINDQGELYPAKRGPDLTTKQRYCDFVLEADFKMGPKAKANSGVFIHVHDPHQNVNTGMEVQILDNGDYKVPFNAGNANGALYDLVRPAVDANKPIGQWNHFRITVDGPLVLVELNGKQIVKANLDQWTRAGQNPDGAHNKFPYAIGALPREGFIALQNYGATPVWFRNVKLKPLSDRKPQYTGKEPIAEVLKVPARTKVKTQAESSTGAEPISLVAAEQAKAQVKVQGNRKLSVTPPKGAIVLFGGKPEQMRDNWYARRSKNPSGWKVDDKGVASPNNRDITSKQEFGDGYLHAEFRTPLKGEGNSGVCMQGRYEVQILNSYGKKKPNAEDCGALYSQTPPKVNASKPNGEWQTFDIFFRAPRFNAKGKVIEPAHATVYQNGVLIHEDQVFRGPTGIQYEEFKGEVAKGPIILQGDHGPVQFRNVWIVPAKE